MKQVRNNYILLFPVKADPPPAYKSIPSMRRKEHQYILEKDIDRCFDLIQAVIDGFAVNPFKSVGDQGG
jgi:hypothetical protein